MITILIITMFIALVAIIAIIRVKTDGKYEIKIGDALIALLPIAIFLLLSGKIAELSVGDMSIKLKEDLKKKVLQESSLKNSAFLDGKRSFAIGVDCDYKIEESLLNKSPMPGQIPHSYITFQNNCVDDKKGNRQTQFWGIISFEDYNDMFLRQYAPIEPATFLSWVKSKNIVKLKTIPSFVSVENAVTPETDKLKALEIMENLNVEFLPVINHEKLFLGVITKEKLASNLILNLATDLN